mmetsp:Transcript_11838/g.21599  ORF Transcript_11838/g.21599 Transcript_11838/m.21599 type:complete len:411 (-) Transcript_11838:36-1268(-)
MTRALKGPAHEHVELLDGVFGPEYFEHIRVLLTVARDVSGVMKVGHRLQAKLHEEFGSMVEVCMEHVKFEWWSKLHDTTNTMGVQKGSETPESQVTYIPDGVRTHPYKRDALPTLEVLLLWEDRSGATRGHQVYSMNYPDAPALEQVEAIFDMITPYFAKRWLHIELCVAPRPQLTDITAATAAPDAADEQPEDNACEGMQATAAGMAITVLACHALGFARNQSSSGIAHVTQCQPMSVRSVADDSGKAKICFLPADINKVQVAETEKFYGTEVQLLKEKMRPMGEGPTVLKVELVPKAAATLTVHVFVMPAILPSTQETDGIVDWAAEAREPLPAAEVEVTPLKEGAVAQKLAYLEADAFVPGDGSYPEGFISFAIRCPGYLDEEHTLMILEGDNDFYFPLRRSTLTPN